MKGKSSVMFSMHCKLSFKVIVIGDQGVGKTSLIVRYIKDVFSKDYKVTVGFEFYSKVVKHEEDDLNIQIWDTAGQEAFKAMIRSFYRNAACVFLMFSLDKPHTLDALKRWTQQINEHSNPNIVKVLVASKSDLNDNDDGALNSRIDEFISKNKIDLFKKVSSKISSNVEELFNHAVGIMYNRYADNQDYRDLVSPPNNKSSFLIPSKEEESKKNKIKKDSDGCC